MGKKNGLMRGVGKQMPVFPIIFSILTTCGWLVPNHYLPWLAAWGDGLAIQGVLLLALSLVASVRGVVQISWRLPALAAICLAMVLGQLAVGKLLFSGDAVMVSLYIGIWFCAVLCGNLMFASNNTSGAMDALLLAWLFVALISVGIALAQWTGALSLYIYAADLPPGGRPFANVAQPNHFCTLSFLGLCGLLWQHQRAKVGNAVFMLAASFLLFGMVASQSRTGWLQIGGLFAWGVMMRGRADLRITIKYLSACAGLFVLGVMLWPVLCEFLLLPSGRQLGEQMQAGVRLPYWWSMIDAIGREPFSGYGWLQTGVAQQRVALDHSAVGGLFEYSHNLVLDLLLWNGVPVAALILAILAGWFIRHVRTCRVPESAWLLLAIVGVFVHGMLEYPLAYAYFLIPVGLAMGAIESVSPNDKKMLRIPRWALLLFALSLWWLFTVVAGEYFKAEERFRSLRFELARIGTEHVLLPDANGNLLPQLYEFMSVYRIPARPNMPPEEVERMRRVSLRYGFPALLFRYSLAAGFNHQPDVARDTLVRICHMHAAERCREARDTWVEMRKNDPQLADIPLPEIPSR